VCAPWVVVVCDARADDPTQPKATRPVPEVAWREDVQTSTVGEADGTFRFEGLAPGRYHLAVGGAGGAPAPPLAFGLAPGDHHDVGDVVLRANGRVEGRVVAPAGSPLAGVGIHHVRMGGPNGVPETWTDA
jgi:hypothetical protein